jgi:hypothetical protein
MENGVNVIFNNNPVTFQVSPVEFNACTVSFPSSTVTFNSNLPTSTLTPSADNQLITRIYADSRYAEIATANAFTLTNTFDSFLPTSIITTATLDAQFITKGIADDFYGRLGVANTWTSTNTFDINLPTSTQTPILSTQLITKSYADTNFQPAGSYALLNAPNEFTDTNIINDPSIPVTINNWNFATPARPLNNSQVQTAPYSAVTGWTLSAVVGTPFQVAIIHGFAGFINTYETLYPDYPTVTQAIGISQNTVPNTFRIEQNISFTETGNHQLTFWIWGMYNTYRTTQTITASINSYTATFIGVEQLWTKCLLRFNIATIGSYNLVFDFINTFSGSVLCLTDVKIEKQTGLIVSDGGVVNNQMINKNGLYTTAIENRGPITNYGYLKNYGALGLFAPYSNGSVVIGTSSYGTVNPADGGAGSVFIGSSNVVASPNVATIANYCIGIGMGALEQLTAANRLHAIGFRCLRWNSGSADNVAYGYSCGEYLGYSGSSSNRNVTMGNYSLNKAQSSSDNVSLGYNNMSTVNFTTGTNFCVSVGSSSMASVCSSYNTQIGYGAVQNMLNTASTYNTFVGAQVCNSQSGAANVLQYCTFLGAGSNVTSSSTYRNSTALGYGAVITEGYECVIGGDDATGADVSFPRLTIPNKTRLACNQSPTGATITLTFRTNENVILTDAVTTTINLPTPASANSRNVGCKFNIIRAVTTTNNISINAPAGQTIGINDFDGSISASSSYIMRKGENQLSLLCVGKTGMTWMVINNSLATSTDVTLLSSVIPIPTVNFGLSFSPITAGVFDYYEQFSDPTNLNYKPSTATLTATNIAATNINATNITMSGSGLVDIINTQSITGTKNFNVLSATTYKYNSVSPMLISTGASALAVTIPITPYSFYPFTMKSTGNIDVTLPEITASNGLLGTQITFKRIGGALNYLQILQNASKQASFLVGNSQGIATSYYLILNTQSCASLTAIQTQEDLGNGTFTSTAGSATITIHIAAAGTLFIGGKINLNTVDKVITGYGTGTGGAGTYTVDSVMPTTFINQVYISSASFGWAVTSID